MDFNFGWSININTLWILKSIVRNEKSKNFEKTDIKNGIN